jgi:hypothetical protein
MEQGVLWARCAQCVDVLHATRRHGMRSVGTYCYTKSCRNITPSLEPIVLNLLMQVLAAFHKCSKAGVSKGASIGQAWTQVLGVSIFEAVAAKQRPGVGTGEQGLGDAHQDLRLVVFKPVGAMWGRAIEQANVD